jgi:hypothetical protein
MNQNFTPKAGRGAPSLPPSLPPVEGAALIEGPGGIVLCLCARGGGTFQIPLSPDALRDIAALATITLERRRAVH